MNDDNYFAAKVGSARILVLISDTDISELVLNIVASMVEANLDVKVVVYDSGTPRILNDLVDLNVDCERVDRGKRNSYFSIISTLANELDSKQYSTVYMSGQYATFVGVYITYLKRIPKRVITRHHSDSNFINRWKSLRLFRGYFFDISCNLLATQIVAVSSVVRNQMISHEFAKEKKVTTIENSVSERFRRIHRKYKNGEKLKIGVISRQTKLKGIEYVAEAFSEYYKENQNSELIIVGANSDSSNEISKILNHLPQEAYEFVTRVSDVLEFYSEIDIFIHVPITETAEAFGLVYLEALFSGVYCVFTRSGIISTDNELIDYCEIVKYKDSKSILTSIRNFALGKSQMRVIPNEIFQKYSTNSMKNKYKEIWLS